MISGAVHTSVNSTSQRWENLGSRQQAENRRAVLFSVRKLWYELMAFVRHRGLSLKHTSCTSHSPCKEVKSSSASIFIVTFFLSAWSVSTPNRQKDATHQNRQIMPWALHTKCCFRMFNSRAKLPPPNVTLKKQQVLGRTTNSPNSCVCVCPLIPCRNCSLC